MDIYQIIRRPLITEKSTKLAQSAISDDDGHPIRGGAYTFEVDPKASKPMIRDAIEKIYKVKVVKVHTQNRQGKSIRFKWRMGQRGDWKKAIVVLHGDYHIDLF